MHNAAAGCTHPSTGLQRRSDVVPGGHDHPAICGQQWQDPRQAVAAKAPINAEAPAQAQPPAAQAQAPAAQTQASAAKAQAPATQAPAAKGNMWAPRIGTAVLLGCRACLPGQITCCSAAAACCFQLQPQCLQARRQRPRHSAYPPTLQL
jgi:hypothetical protein